MSFAHSQHHFSKPHRYSPRIYALFIPESLAESSFGPFSGVHLQADRKGDSRGIWRGSLSFPLEGHDDAPSTAPASSGYNHRTDQCVGQGGWAISLFEIVPLKLTCGTTDGQSR